MEREKFMKAMHGIIAHQRSRLQLKGWGRQNATYIETHVIPT